MKPEAHNLVAYRSVQLRRSFAVQPCPFCSLSFTSRLTGLSDLSCSEHRIFQRGHPPAVRPHLTEPQMAHISMRLGSFADPCVESYSPSQIPKGFGEPLLCHTVTFSGPLCPSIYRLWGFIHVPWSNITLFGAL